ncbi:MAG: hypothetical protein FWE66_00510, partial [Oscillospiraceae bacterium]|nr:hypothetical protein [Oscillospiraceae bacterium]
LNRGVEFIYSGGTVPGMGAVAPADGALTLDEFGKDSFTLKHGQAITILNVPADVKIRLIEAVDNSYSPSFTDSAGAGGANDTDFRVLSAGGATERVFEFFNAQKVDPVPTGIADGLFGTGVLPMLALLLLYPGWLTIWLILRRPAAK